MILPILPDEARVDLSEAGYPGLVAVYRPMDVLDKSRWYDETRGIVGTNESTTLAVRRQLLRIEDNGKSAEAQMADGSLAPFDPRNEKHFAAVPLVIVWAVFNAMYGRATLSEDERKN